MLKKDFARGTVCAAGGLFGYFLTLCGWAGSCCQHTFLPVPAGRLHAFPALVVPVHLAVLLECCLQWWSGIVAVRVHCVAFWVVAVHRSAPVAVVSMVWAVAVIGAKVSRKERKNFMCECFNCE